MTRTGYLGLALFLALAGSTACKKNDQAKEEAKKVTTESTRDATKDLVDENYRFTLQWPGTGWKLMGTDDIRNISPDAVAGMNHSSGLNGLVIVEHSPSIELEKMADIIIDSMPIEGKEIEYKRVEPYLDLESVSYRVVGRISDIPMEYEGRIFSRGEYVYQLIALAPQGIATASDFEKVFAAMKLDEGEIKVPEDSSALKDTSGVGWRLRSGVFESAISGIRVEPPEGWRVVTGAEAARINADAEVALVSRNPEAYMVVIPEIIGKAKPEVYAADRLTLTKENLGAGVEEKTVQATLLGKEQSIWNLTGTEVPWTFNLGVAFYDEWAVQVIGWYNKTYGDKGRDAVTSAMASMSILSASEREALVKELEAIPDRQNFVGEDHVLRNRVFRDFERGIRWTAPKGFWQMTVGQAVREVNPAAQLYARFDNSALHLLVIGESTIPGVESKAYHELAANAVASNLNFELETKSKGARFKAAKALYSEGVAPVAGLGLRYRVYSAVEGARAVQLHIWGAEAAFERNQAMIDQAAANLELLDTLPAVENKGDAYVDHRLGFRLEGMQGLGFKDNTPAEMKGIAAFPGFGVDGHQWIGVLAICALDDSKDDDWFMNFMEQRLREGYAQFVAGKPSEAELELAGRPARHLTWKSRMGRLDAFMLLEGRTLYALIAVDGGGSSRIRDRAVEAFSLLE